MWCGEGCSFVPTYISVLFELTEIMFDDIDQDTDQFNNGIFDTIQVNNAVIADEFPDVCFVMGPIEFAV